LPNVTSGVLYASEQYQLHAELTRSAQQGAKVKLADQPAMNSLQDMLLRSADGSGTEKTVWVSQKHL
jgi:hypothetical protein